MKGIAINTSALYMLTCDGVEVVTVVPWAARVGDLKRTSATVRHERNSDVHQKWRSTDPRAIPL